MSTASEVTKQLADHAAQLQAGKERMDNFEGRMERLWSSVDRKMWGVLLAVVMCLLAVVVNIAVQSSHHT